MKYIYRNFQEYQAQNKAAFSGQVFTKKIALFRYSNFIVEINIKIVGFASQAVCQAINYPGVGQFSSIDDALKDSTLYKLYLKEHVEMFPDDDPMPENVFLEIHYHTYVEDSLATVLQRLSEYFVSVVGDPVKTRSKLGRSVYINPNQVMFTSEGPDEISD